MRRLLSGVIVIAAIAGTTAGAFGRDDRWSSGFGMGVCEALVTSGAGNQIYVACDCGSAQPSSISFMLGGGAPKGDRIFLSFDGADAEDIWISEGGITSDCRACAGTFEYVRDALKRHGRVRVMAQNGDAATFTLVGSSEAIGECSAAF